VATAVATGQAKPAASEVWAMVRVSHEKKNNTHLTRVRQALYDCAAERDDELSFARGDMLQVLDMTDPNWWQMALHDKVNASCS
jgi:hypothetical protein